jgi:hypothetical protein
MSKRTGVVIIIGMMFAVVVAVATAGANGGRLVGTRHARVVLGHITATCQQGRLPDRRCTPGATFNVGARQVCVPGYSQRVRDVPESEKRQVYAEYGIRSHQRGQYEVDHLLSGRRPVGMCVLPACSLVGMSADKPDEGLRASA